MKNLHTKKTKNVSAASKVGIFSMSLLLTASAVYLYSPTFGSHADTSKTAEVNLTVGEAMSLSLDKNNLALTADINSFTSGDITATAITNSQYGYTLTLEDVDSSSDMTHTNSSIADVLTSSFSGAKTSAQMTNNSWGFSLNATDYYMIPTNGNPVALKRTNSPMATDSEDTVVTFGAKVGNITSGTYTDSVLFTIYTNGATGEPSDGTETLEPGVPPETRTISDITNMQDMNKKICANTPLETSATVTDSRDGSTYTIAKLKDGECWMTSNLKLQNYTVTSADTDVPDGYSYEVPASTLDWANDGYVYEFNKLYVDDTYGGYYTYYVTTAGAPYEDSDIPEHYATQSICPKGWRLPTADYSDSETIRLSKAYRVRINGNADVIGLVTGLPNYQLNGKVSYGTIQKQGEEASYWTRNHYGTVAKYFWLKPQDGAITGYNYNETGYATSSYGFGIRCIANN